MLYAIENRDLYTVKSLLQQGFDPNIPITEYGFQPAYVAICNCSPSILNELICHGADINTCSIMITTLLQAAIQLYPSDPETSAELVHVLTRDERIYNRDILGQCLQYASGMGYVDIVGLLLQAKSDPNYFPADDEYEMTPLVGMIFENEMLEGHQEIAKMLIASGADPFHKSGERTVLQYAQEYSRCDLIPILERRPDQYEA